MSLCVTDCVSIKTKTKIIEKKTVERNKRPEPEFFIGTMDVFRSFHLCVEPE